MCSSPVNMPDPTRKRFGYGQLWPVRPACRQNWPGSYITCQIRIPASVSAPFFQRRHGSYRAEPTRIRSGWPAWSGFDQTHLVWKQAGVQELPALFLAERNRSATSFPLSGTVPFFHKHPGQYCAKPVWIRFSSG